jgi:hypothetical protein
LGSSESRVIGEVERERLEEPEGTELIEWKKEGARERRSFAGQI